jgi:hypothetical protein
MNFNQTNHNAYIHKIRGTVYVQEQFSDRVATEVRQRATLGFIFKARMLGMFRHYLYKRTSK